MLPERLCVGRPGRGEATPPRPVCVSRACRICYTSPARYREVRPWIVHPVSQGRYSGFLAG
jgi:hypothetical protein